MTVALVYLWLLAVTTSLEQMLAPAISRLAAVLFVSLPLFAIEHVVGLGSLSALWPVLTLLSLWVLSGHREKLGRSGTWRAEAPFLAGFALAALWRYHDPDIEPTGEQIPNLYFISNYLDGARLPPPDQWLGLSRPFDFYYAFQHYATALLARVLDLTGGQAMNIGFCLLFGFAVSLVWYGATAWGVPRAARALLLCTVFVGGSGLAPLVQMSVSIPADTSLERTNAATTLIWASTRWSGLYEERINTPIGKAMFQDPSGSAGIANAPDLPLETFLYYSLLGDFHPPLGGFLILIFSLALIAALQNSTKPPHSRSTELMIALLAATPALALVINAWVFPLQLGLVGLWLVLRWTSVRDLILIRAAALGGIVSVLCIAPFLASFASSALSPSVETVPDVYRTRLAIMLALLWPAALLVLSLLIAQVRDRWAWGLVAFIMAAGVASELFFFDDPLSARYERFNTVLKVWSWLWVAVLVGLAPMAITSRASWARRISLTTLTLLLLPGAWNASQYLWHGVFPHKGRLSGDGWRQADAAHQQMMLYLRHSPRGVVLENPRQGAYSSYSTLALFAAQPSLIGWSSTQSLWRGGSVEITQRADESRQLFMGTLTDPRSWLEMHRVTYILWTRDDAINVGAQFPALSDTLAQDYEFRAFEYMGTVPIGLWQRRAPSGTR